MCIYKGNKRWKWYSGEYIDEMRDAYLDNAIQLLQDRFTLSDSQRIMLKGLVQERIKRKSRRYSELYGLRGTISTL